MLKDNEGKIEATGLRINRGFLEQVNKDLNSLDKLEVKKINTPLPCEIKEECLKCFNEKLILKDNIAVKSLEPFKLVLIYLWEYDKYREYLNDENENLNEYIFRRLNFIKNNIDRSIKAIIKNSNDFEMNDEIVKLTKEILYENKRFADNEINIWINKVYSI